MKLKTYSIQATGRRIGAIGSFYEFETYRFATDPDQALLNIYDEWEHVSNPVVKEIPSPFDVEGLRIAVMNDKGAHQAIQFAVSSAMRAVIRQRDALATANKEWHDDPESADHKLYHTPADAQYPPEVVTRCVAECLLYFLENTPAGQTVYDSLQLPEFVN